MPTTTSAEADRAFSDLGLAPPLLHALEQLGYEEPTPIQRIAIPPLLEGRDLLGLAATGTGKTAAFALPLLQRVGKGSGLATALILVPTRELAVQVAQAVHRYGRELSIEVLPIYGGQAFRQQLRVLKRGVDVVVATPGRALDHIRRGTLDLSQVEAMVLDEADEMLDMGFADDIDEILAAVPTERQTLLFSATLSPRIAQVARRHLNDPVEVRIGEEESGDAGPRVAQRAYLVRRPHKTAALGRVLDLEAPDAALVFCRTRNDVDELVEALNARGYRAEAMHGGMSQDERERVMRKLRGGAVDLLVATDVAARGLDVSHLTHVINYEVPNAPRSYVHRIGRVGRAGREGVAITLVDPREHALLRNIERLTKQKIAVEALPTVADMRAHRMELTRASLREAILDGGLDHFRVVVDTLTDEFDLWDVAAGAVKMAHEGGLPDGEHDEEEIPTARLPRNDRTSGPRGGTDRKRGGSRGGPMTRIFVGVGRRSGVRPKDLVGAITGEAGIRGHQIGTIQITEKFSLVEISAPVVSQVVQSLKRTSIKGLRVKVKIDGGR